jgi:hypothetical protein
MTTTPRTFESKITAFMENPDAPRPENPIHSTGGAQEYGYRAALVGGVTVYGWAASTILEALGERWLWDGWVDVSFRRPTYPGQGMTTRVTEGDDGVWDFAMVNDEGDSALSGQVGLGRAPWFDMFELPQNRTAEERPAELPQLTLEDAPVGRDLRPMAVTLGVEEARQFAIEREAASEAVFTEAERPLLHPGWIAGRMTPFVHHSYDYGPAIHARSHIQHLARAEAGQTLTVAGHMLRAYERKGHHYHETDGVLLAEDGTELAYLRHTSIFNVAKRG